MNAPAEFTTLLRRWNALGHEQLQIELAALAAQNERLVQENAELQARLARAEEDADAFWHDAIGFQQQLAEQSGGTPGITRDGAFVVTPAENVA